MASIAGDGPNGWAGLECPSTVTIGPVGRTSPVREGGQHPGAWARRAAVSASPASAGRPHRRPRRVRPTRPTADGSLYLVTPTGPGSASTPTAAARASPQPHCAEQDATLVGGRRGRPGLPLDDRAQRVRRRPDARPGRPDLADDPRCARVDSVRPPGRRRAPGRADRGGLPRRRGRRGDRGRRLRAVARQPVVRRRPAAWAGRRALPGPARPARLGADVCDDKIVGAHWFVDGFGATGSWPARHLSPLDDDGHGTQVASIAAGNAGVR